MDLTRLRHRASRRRRRSRSVQRFHHYPSSAFNIVATAYKFSGYLQPQNILSGNIFGLIQTNKMAAIANFLLFFHFSSSSYSLAVLQPQFSNFQDKLCTIRGCLKILFLECVCVYVCALAWLAKFTFSPLQQILFYIDLSNFQYIFITIRGSHQPNLVAQL